MRDLGVVFSFPSNTVNSECGKARDDIHSSCSGRVGISQIHPPCCRAADLAVGNPAAAKPAQGD